MLVQDRTERKIKQLSCLIFRLAITVLMKIKFLFLMPTILAFQITLLV
nr:MAG TPA_asm: hypothetical protein [Caudoviricetes sp.]